MYGHQQRKQDTEGGIYISKRLIENLSQWLPSSFECVGDNEIPAIIKEENTDIPENWLGFNYCKSARTLSGVGIHMFVDDYQLQRLWNAPSRYIDALKKAALVCSPDFGLYVDVPKVLNMYNHYRKHWLAAYWQREGIKVIPTVCWSDEDSFAWCFDGDPIGGTVAVSSVGTQRNADSREAFMLGYDAMLERLHPETILFWGIVPPDARGNIIPMGTFTDQMKARKEALA